ncbi:helix-turn-helix domain-containing protein [Paludisphaera rhizosphaerae]|uniref:helix-turn-helix domain-containing protein n=2 Tax=Paludisphaera rhizosphaerae TaxID=2711216 RepID=UPI0021020138|nr:helix-turn-helix domain-containing protein [Paludisphaera rhizosphaerae]
MMTLAQRVRDFRYAKGWGPDELANRAEISRTALYQIESGKTGLPRAGTLRRIAVALDVSMDALLGETDDTPTTPGEKAPGFRARGLDRWFPAEGGPLSLPSTGHPGLSSPIEDRREPVRPVAETHTRSALPTADVILHREGELMSKLHDLLHSSMGTAVAKVIDELHGVLPRSRNSI